MQGGQGPESTSQPGFKSEGTAWSKNMFKPAERVFTKPTRPILIEDGIGAVLDQKENNKYVFPILKGDIGTFSMHKSTSEEGESTSVGLVSGTQLTVVAGY